MEKLMYKEIYEKLKSYGQEHLLKFWNELPEKQKKILINQLNSIDWKNVDKLIKSHVLRTPDHNIPVDLAPAPFFPIVPKDKEQETLYNNAIKKGKELLSSGKVAAFTVAGGQGTRLGFDAITTFLSASVFISEALNHAR